MAYIDLDPGQNVGFGNRFNMLVSVRSVRVGPVHIRAVSWGRLAGTLQGGDLGVAPLKLGCRAADPVPTMVEDHLRLGSLISAAGAALLAVSVFLPWYGVSLTASGVASAQQALNNVAQQYGNATFQTQAKTIGLEFDAFTGHQVTTLSAHQALKYLNVILLILAAIAFLAALLRLAGVSEPIQTGGSQIAFVGLLATVCVLFRMVERPAPLEEVFSLSLSWGIWLALASSVAVVIGSLWPASHEQPESLR